MIRLIRAPYLVPALAVLALFGTRASASFSGHTQGEPSITASTDPDPADCPFCGGNASLHVQRIDGLERATLAMYTSLLR